ncbi:hypothetical protein MC885_017507 [Smutsia gigantea]|nr:hypothetical protein MC885_017507 [Smutsia gigantea]
MPIRVPRPQGFTCPVHVFRERPTDEHHHGNCSSCCKTRLPDCGESRPSRPLSILTAAPLGGGLLTSHPFPAARMQTQDESSRRLPKESSHCSQLSSVTSETPQNNGDVVSVDLSCSRGGRADTIKQPMPQSSQPGPGHPSSPLPGISKSKPELAAKRFLRGLHASTRDPHTCSSCRPALAERHTAGVHSEPLFRKDFQHTRPPLCGPGVSARVPHTPRPHASEYYIVNDCACHRNIHPTFWPERHFKVDALKDTVEMCPRNMRQCVSWAPRWAPPTELGDKEEEVLRREEIERPFHLRSLTGLQGPPHSYVGERSPSQPLAPEPQGTLHHKPWDDGFQGPLDGPRYVHRKPHPRNAQGPRTPVESRGKAKPQPALTESDSLLAASGTNQQNSSADQYLQLARSRGKSPRSVGHLSGRKTTSRPALAADLDDLVCSDV